MKSISFTAFSILAILLVTPAYAAPVGNPPNRAKTVVDYIINPSHSTSINPACFYSGTTNGKSARDALGSFKGAPRNCHSIDDIVGRAGVQTRSLTPRDWSAISKALAQHVSGKAYALLGKDVEPGSGWLVDEKPVLKVNGKVHLEIWTLRADGRVENTGMTNRNM